MINADDGSECESETGPKVSPGGTCRQDMGLVDGANALAKPGGCQVVEYHCTVVSRCHAPTYES
jgi:hypothetical protein